MSSFTRLHFKSLIAVVGFAITAYAVGQMGLWNHAICGPSQICHLPPSGRGIYLLLFAAVLNLYALFELAKAVHPLLRKSDSGSVLTATQVSTIVWNAAFAIGSGLTLLVYLLILGTGLG